MYINIKDFNGKNIEEVKNALSALGVEFEVHSSSLKSFFEDESKFRLEWILENLSGNGLYDDEEIELLETEEVFNEIASEIAVRFFDSGYVFDYDLMDDIVREEIDAFLKNKAE